MTPAYTDVEGVAAMLGRTPKAIRMLVQRREIPHIRVGRKIQFRLETVERWMQQHRRNGAFVE